MIVVFPDHSRLNFSYASIILTKIQQKSGVGVIRGWGRGLSCNKQFLEYKSCGILTSTDWSVVAGHVVIAIHRGHSLKTNRAGQILVLSEHLFTLKGKGT